jgi:hypothetical protein
MNKPLVVAAALAVASLVAGCQRKAEPTAAPPTSTTISAEQREALAKKAPNAIIGTVTHAMPESRMVRVGDVDVSQFKRNDTVVFSAANDDLIAAGWVVEVKDDSVHVQYAEPRAGQRAPLVGDLALKFRDDAK